LVSSSLEVVARVAWPGHPSHQPRLISYAADFLLNHVAHDLLRFWETHGCDLQYGGFTTHLFAVKRYDLIAPYAWDEDHSG
jgi:hypothetical protein